MYLPPHFSETDSEQSNALIDSRPLATLVAMTDAGLVANHIPMLRDGDNALIGHITLANELHQIVGEGSQVLAIFGGEDS